MTVPKILGVHGAPMRRCHVGDPCIFQWLDESFSNSCSFLPPTAGEARQHNFISKMQNYINSCDIPSKFLNFVFTVVWMYGTKWILQLFNNCSNYTNP